jgi:hypothetical protein
MLDPDPDWMNPDPKHCKRVYKFFFKKKDKTFGIRVRIQEDKKDQQKNKK